MKNLNPLEDTVMFSGLELQQKTNIYPIENY